MDPIQILIIAVALSALLVIVLVISSAITNSKAKKSLGAIKEFAAQSGYTIEYPADPQIDWQIQTDEWLLYFDHDRNAETPAPTLHLTSKIPLTSAIEFAAVCNHARKTLKSGYARGALNFVTDKLVFTSTVKTDITLQSLYDLLDRDYSSPLGKNEKPYLHLFANSAPALNAINASQIPNLSDQLNSGEQRSSFNNTPHIVKINHSLEISAHCKYATVDKIKAIIALHEAVKNLG